MERKGRVCTPPETVIETNVLFTLSEKEVSTRMTPSITLALKDHVTYIRLTPFGALELADYLLRWAAGINENIRSHHPSFSGPRR